MWTQAAGLFLTAATHRFEWWLAGALLLGLGTAMVYPSLIAAVSDASHPSWRARSLSVYRFWRDLGYAIGALSSGLIADIFGLSWAIASIAALTFLSVPSSPCSCGSIRVALLTLPQDGTQRSGLEWKSKGGLEPRADREDKAVVRHRS